jgi:branched-chain amino acid transport system substrate-binding protein
MRDPLRALLVTPVSGPLARYGAPGAAALRLWATRSEPAVDLEIIDANPSVAAAMHEAEARQPDLLFGPYGSGPALQAARATRRMLWNHGAATERLQRQAFPHVVNVMAPARMYFDRVLRAMRNASLGIDRVSLLHSTTGFGREVASGAESASRELGIQLHVVAATPGRMSEAAAAVPHGDALLVAGAFDDELAAATVLLPGSWRAAAFVGAGVDEVLEPLGASREGLLGPAQWLARTAGPPASGPSTAWFVDAFRAATGSEPPYPAAAAFAAGVLAAYCLREAGGADDAAMLRVASDLDVRTLFGRFRLDAETGVQVGHEVLVVQWQSGARRVVWPPEEAEAPLIAARQARR